MRMVRPLSVVLTCVLLVTTAGTVPVLSSSPSSAAQAASPSGAVLTVDSPDRSGFANRSIDVGSALSMGRTAAAARLDQLSLEESFERTEDTAGQRRLIRQATLELEDRVAELERDARTLRRAYLDRRIDTAGYLRGLARLDARARALKREVGTVSRLADRVPGTTVSDRLAVLQAVLEGYTGPVRQRVAAASRGDAPPTMVYAIAGRNGTALSMLVEDRYVREAHRPDQQTSTSDPEFGINEVIEYLSVLYPGFASSTPALGITGLPDFNPRAYYRLDIGFDDRAVEAYLDTGSRSVFHEVQVRPLVTPTGSRSVVETENGTTLVVNRTYPGGPLRIATYDDATGQPTSATVTVADRELSTGTDGSVWVLSPRVGFRVTAIRPSGNVSVLVSPLEPVPVGAGVAEG